MTAFFLLLSSSALAVTVSGKITDDSGNPINEAVVQFISDYPDTVRVKTDENGCYSAELPVYSTAVGDEPVPQAFRLHQNFPNPFNPSTTISYELDRDMPVELDIFSITGQHVRTLSCLSCSAGVHSVVWDGCGENGVKAAAGVYFYRLKAGGAVETRKMLLLDGGSGNVSAQPVHVAAKTAQTAAVNVWRLAVGKVGYDSHVNEQFAVDSSGDIVYDVSLPVYEGFAMYLSVHGNYYYTSITHADYQEEEIIFPAFLTEKDFASYTIITPDDRSYPSHVITYSNEVWERLKKMSFVTGKIFIVTVGEEKMYWGGFAHPASSHAAENPVIALGIDLLIGDAMFLERCYPLCHDVSDPDPREDSRIIERLESVELLKRTDQLMIKMLP